MSGSEGPRYCYCGCGMPVSPGEDFCWGHGLIAAMNLIKLDYGDIKGFLRSRGFGPDPDKDWSLAITMEEEAARRKPTALRGTARVRRRRVTHG